MSTSLELQTKLGTQEVQENPRLRMKTMVALVSRYLATYADQYEYENYQDHTFLNDVLYIMGVALNPKEHTFADGFDRFKMRLTMMLVESLTDDQLGLILSTVANSPEPEPDSRFERFTDQFKLSDEI